MKVIKHNILINPKLQPLKRIKVDGDDIATDLSIDEIISVRINSDVNTLTDTAQIVIPKHNIKVFSKKLVFNITESDEVDTNVTIEIGSYINISIWYEDYGFKSKVQFIGYIKEFKDINETIVIECEDSMYVLKHVEKQIISINPMSLASEKLNPDDPTYVHNILNAMLRFSDINIQEDRLYLSKFTTGNFRLGNFMYPSEILEKLKKEYHLYAYFRNSYREEDKVLKTVPILRVGLKHLQEAGDKKKEYLIYKYKSPAKNISETKTADLTESDTFTDKDINIIKSNNYDISLIDANPIIDAENLTYKYYDKDDLIILFTSKQDDNKVFKSAYAGVGNPIFTNGEKGENVKFLKSLKDLESDRGNKIKISIPNQNKENILKYVKNAFNTYPESRFEGEIVVFGQPVLRHSDVITLYIDNGVGMENVIKESYFIDRVITDVNENNGFTQRILLGDKIK